MLIFVSLALVFTWHPAEIRFCHSAHPDCSALLAHSHGSSVNWRRPVFQPGDI